MHEDGADPPEMWKPVFHEFLSYRLVRDESGEAIGVFIVALHSMTMFEIHEAFLPSAWGPKARRAAREFRAWLWRETKCKTLIGKIVASNRTALAYAKAAGMEVFGVIPKSFQRDGVFEDLVIVGLSRPEGS